MSYSRMERRQIQPSAIELKPMIDGMISQRAHDIESGNIRITVNLPFESVKTDMETLRQVLGNYLDNAVKFSKKDAPGVVEVGGEEKTGCLDAVGQRQRYRIRPPNTRTVFLIFFNGCTGLKIFREQAWGLLS